MPPKNKLSDKPITPPPGPRRGAQRNAKKAAPPLALQQQQATDQSTALISTQPALKLPSERDLSNLKPMIEPLSGSAFYFQKEFLTAEIVRRRLCNTDNMGWSREQTASWFEQLCGDLARGSEYIQLIAYYIEEISNNGEFKADGQMMAATRAAFASIKPMAKEGRKAVGRLTGIRAKMYDFFGEEWCNVFWEPFLTVGMGDEFVNKIPKAKMADMPALEITEYIHSAWAKRLQGLVEKGPGPGQTPSTLLTTVDVKNGFDAIKHRYDETNVRLPNFEKPSQKLVSSYNAWSHSTYAKSKYGVKLAVQIYLDKYQFLHVGRIVERRLIRNIPNAKPFLPKTLTTQGRIIYDDNLIEEIIADSEKKSTPKEPTPKKPTPKKPSSLPPPPPTPKTENMTRGFDDLNLNLGKETKRTASALSSQSHGRHQPTRIPPANSGTSKDPIDVETYQRDTRPLRFTSMIAAPSSPIEKEIDVIRDANPWEVELPERSKAGSPSTYFHLDNLGRRLKIFFEPANATPLEKQVCAYLVSIVCSSNDTPQADFSLIQNVKGFQRFSKRDLQAAITRVGKHTLNINTSKVANGQWPQEWLEAFRRAVYMFYGTNLTELCERPEWIQLIEITISRVVGAAMESNNQHTPIKVGHNHNGSITMRASQLAMDELVWNGGRQGESGWLSITNLRTSMLLLLQEHASRFDVIPARVFIDGQRIRHWRDDGINYKAKRMPLFPQVNQDGSHKPWEEQKWSELPTIPSGVREIYIPINLNESHWVLVVVDLHTKHVHCLDSFNGKSTYADMVITWLQTAVENAPWATIPWKCPQQSNGADCGFWVLQHAKRWCEQGQPELTQVSTEDLRLRVAHQLAQAYKHGWNTAPPPAKDRPRTPSPVPSNRPSSQVISPSGLRNETRPGMEKAKSLSPGLGSGSGSGLGLGLGPLASQEGSPGMSRVQQLRGQRKGTLSPPRHETIYESIEFEHSQRRNQKSTSPMSVSASEFDLFKDDTFLQDIGFGQGAKLSTPIPSLSPSRQTTSKALSPQSKPTPQPEKKPTPQPGNLAPLGRPVLVGPGQWMVRELDRNGKPGTRSTGDRNAKKWFKDHNLPVPTVFFEYELN